MQLRGVEIKVLAADRIFDPFSESDGVRAGAGIDQDRPECRRQALSLRTHLLFDES